MNERGWGLPEMLAFCSILLLGFFSAVVVAKKNFGQLFEEDEKVNLTNDITNMQIINLPKEEAKEVVISYDYYEGLLKKAAINYHKNNNGDKKLITLSELIEKNYIKEIHDPNEFENICNGYVIYFNSEYNPYLRCIGNYATEGYDLDYEN